MQLFSIGLVERNLDFTPIEIAGEPVPTYHQDMITDMARVLTGLGYACSGPRTVAGQTINRTCGCSGIDCNFSFSAFASTPPGLTINEQFGLVHPDRYEPLICYPRFHDIGRDRSGFQLPGPEGAEPAGAEIALLPGEAIPAGTPEAFKSLVLGGGELARIEEISPGEAPDTALDCRFNGLDTAAKEACIAYCDTGLETALEVIFSAANTGTSWSALSTSPRTSSTRRSPPSRPTTRSTAAGPPASNGPRTTSWPTSCARSRGSSASAVPGRVRWCPSTPTARCSTW